MNPGTLEWTVFAAVVAALLIVDIAVASRGRNADSLRRAWIWSGVWIGVAIAFGAWIFVRLDSDAGLSYFTAYFLEKSLSIDNLAVFALVFTQTGMAGPMQRRVLMWGVIGALVMRAALIAGGLYLLAKFQWVVYPFAALLLYAAVHMLRNDAQRRLWVETRCTLCSSWVGNAFERFPYVRYALAALLVFVAIKLGLSAFMHISAGVSLAIIATILLLAAGATRWLPEPRQALPPIAPCAHLDQQRDVAPADTGCTECKAMGEEWLHLRMCTTCGHVGCCESSKYKHAEQHFRESAHPIIRSLEPGERWRWCYIDNAVVGYD